jgi:tyrosine-protein kinase Etk/Wzc
MLSRQLWEIIDDDEISLLDLLQVVVDNLRLLVLGPLACGLLALGYSFTITPTYTAKTQFLPPQQQQSAAASMLSSLGALGGLAGAALVSKALQTSTLPL